MVDERKYGIPKGHGIQLNDETGTYENKPEESHKHWSEIDREITASLPEQKPESKPQPAQTNYNPKTQRR